MEYFRVRNWQRFQHYKDRNPPWIKLHYEIMTSSDWVMLSDASRLLAVVCMMIASRNEGKVPNDPHFLKRVAYLDKLPDLKPLLNCGFIEKLQADDSECKQSQADARSETEAYREEKERDIGAFFAFDWFWEKYPRQRRGDKQETFKAWKKAITKATEEEILNGLEAYIGSSYVSDGYAKGAAAWLNDSRWSWDYTYKPKAKASGKPERPKYQNVGTV